MQLHPTLAVMIELWCFDRSISSADFCLALSVFLCDHRTNMLAYELYERRYKAQFDAEKNREELAGSKYEEQRLKF